MTINNKLTDTEKLAILCAQAAEDKLAENIVLLDLNQITIASSKYLVICNCSSTTQVKSVTDNILNEAIKHELKKPRVEGLENSEWVILDFFDVVVCNPPFYKTQAEAERKNLRKNKNLHGREELDQNFGGNANELWYKGGEEAFIKTMIAESAEFATQVGWFTTLVSKVDHIKTLKRFARKAGASEVKVVEMDQGNKQTRFLAWRFKNTTEV